MIELIQLLLCAQGGRTNFQPVVMVMHEGLLSRQILLKVSSNGPGREGPVSHGRCEVDWGSFHPQIPP
ncbi:hypothetical protein JUNP479_1403 [Aeromonas jandaei]|nr:hypothetical protein JUNP479_1403 [Aeromonas jandaei]